MSDSLDLEDRAIEAVWCYREALAAAANSENAQALAHRALMSILPDLERAIDLHHSRKSYLMPMQER
ncbi:hypothetical protein [Bradyrhizobium elkanii]|uniref:hypothetical protein n=1 Tax=Bradyrhizobium elkanii TaxID=29448 RepID=UPI0006843082|nr:hypothetical protein [Bradyrhizobium elkanii]